MRIYCFCFECFGDHRGLHVLTRSFPTRRSSDLAVGIGPTSVGEYVRRAAVVGITWPIPAELDDAALERALFAPAGYNPPLSRPLPDWELRKSTRLNSSH